MVISEFWQGIGMMAEAVDLLEQLQPEAHEINCFEQIFFKDYEDFCAEVKSKENDRLYFLWYLSYFACQTFDVYKEKKIPEQVFWDTFLDLKLWCENCKTEFGEYGIEETKWFWRHYQLTLFRLGRLEYELMDWEWQCEKDGLMVEKGESVISIHIPQGEPLKWDACEASICAAKSWFGTDKKYVCHSWLLYPGLMDILGEGSNIAEFQRHFKIIGVDYDYQEACQRIFGKIQQSPEDYPSNTSLQAKARKYLMAGHRLGNGCGIYSAL